MAAREGVTERLKANNQFKWVRLMNNIRNRAAEIVTVNLIYNEKRKRRQGEIFAVVTNWHIKTL